jgi:ribosomal RNA assembly protein
MALVMIKVLMLPEDRMAVVIGKRGATKAEIAKKTKTEITIGDGVEIKGEAINVLTAENIITAIARGFSPKNAMLLLDENNTMDIIDLPKDDKKLKRIRSRLIGTNGKCRRNMELLTKTKISIYGRTVGIIGNYENVELAKEGIGRLIKGIAHRNVYEYIESHQQTITAETNEF